MRFSILFFILISISCSKKTKYESVQLYGHAGNGLKISNSVYHDNSAESIELALAQNGCDGVELDVQLSKDGTAWLFHDQKMNDELHVNSCINSQTDEELSKLRYTTFNKEKLLKLTDVVLNSKSVILDLRHSNSCSETIVDLVAMMNQISLFAQKNPQSEVLLNTNYLSWLVPLKALKLKVCYSPQVSENLNDIESNYGVTRFLFKNSEISKDKVSELIAKGNEVILYEVRSPKGIRSALKKLPSRLITDDLKATLIEKY